MAIKLRKQNRRLFQRAFTFAEICGASLAMALMLASAYAAFQSSFGMIKTEDLRATQMRLESMATLRTTNQVNANNRWLSNKQFHRSESSTFVPQCEPQNQVCKAD